LRVAFLTVLILDRGTVAFFGAACLAESLDLVPATGLFVSPIYRVIASESVRGRYALRSCIAPGQGEASK
jgi:hypothetical protein